MDISPGDFLGNYEIVSRLGQGGQADVFKAQAPGQPFVAIKILHSSMAAEEDFVRRFEREAVIISKLDHPNIVKVFDFVAASQRPYMVMEYVEGETLEARLRRLRQQSAVLPIEEVVRIVERLAEAIDYAHSQGMIHRDLKPSNVIFRASNEPVLMDFGIARILGAARFTQSGMLVGTPAYMSPEQCQGEGGDQRSDLYALGVMVYEMACGQLPFVNDNPYGLLMMHINQPPPLPRSLNPALNGGIQGALLQALSKQPERRFPNATGLANALQTGMHKADVEPDLAKEPEVTPIESLQSQLRPSQPLQSRLQPYAPFQAPPELARFVGRDNELEKIRAQISAYDRPVICAVVGMGGIGKTALAVHLAHLLKDQFSGGVLWANMANSEPMAVLDSWAQAYGCDFSGLPDLSSRAVALSGVLHGEKVLFVLDDVSAVQATENVRRLLLGGPGSVMLITTRSTETAAALNARIFSLGVFEPDHSLELMRQIAGVERVSAELRSALEICALLGNLPLAVEIAAQRLASHRRLGLADFVRRLKQEQGRLAELRLSDREVRASFAVSYQVLETSRQRAFQFLGVFAGRALTPAALAFVGQIEEYRAEDHLYALEAVSLIQAVGDSHYRQHPLLADFARELLGSDLMAEFRMIDYYLAFSRKNTTNSKILEEEDENLSASLQTGYQQKEWQTVLEFARLLTSYWFVRGRFSEARQGYHWADEASRQLGSGDGEADICFFWGRACIEQKDYVEAENHLNHSLHLYTKQQDSQGASSAQVHLARIALEHGNYEQAQALLDESKRTRQELGDQAGVAEVLYTSARIDYFHGSFDQAMNVGRQALTIQHALKDNDGAVLTLNLLASIAFEQAQYALADDFAIQSINLCDQLNNIPDRVQPLLILGDVRRKQNQLEEAVQFFEISLDLLKKIGDLELQAEALYSLSKAYLANGDTSQALAAAEKSLEICKVNSAPLLMAFILIQLGDIYIRINQPDLASQYWQRTKDLAVKIESATALRIAESRLNGS